MSVSKQTGISNTARRIYGEQSEPLLDEESETPNSSGPSMQRPHMSSNQGQQRTIHDEEIGVISPSHSERPPIPSALPSYGETTSTPLPILPMIVLSIVCIFSLFCN